MKKILLLLILAFSSSVLPAQIKHFKGEWTKIGTTYLFEFDLYLQHRGNQVEGYFEWKLTRLDEKSFMSEAYYKDRIGSTAREYVKGTYRPGTKEYFLKGYKKDDPDSIIALDTYQLKVDGNGDLGGNTDSNGSGLGRINAKAVNTLPAL